jgi:ABC-type nitrate/sulfonate/bicarbonate transport system permease component
MGYVIVYASTEMDSSAVIAGLVVLGIASYALVYGLQKIERRVALHQGREEL